MDNLKFITVDKYDKVITKFKKEILTVSDIKYIVENIETSKFLKDYIPENEIEILKENLKKNDK